MNKKTKGHWPTVIIMNGRPYQLVKLERKGVNNPCSVCDLRWECDVPNDHVDLLSLCISDDRDDGWYFEEDWSIYDKQICEFVDLELVDKPYDK